MANKPLTGEEKEKIIELFQSGAGFTYDEIASQVNRSHISVHRTLLQAGLIKQKPKVVRANTSRHIAKPKRKEEPKTTVRLEGDSMEMIKRRLGNNLRINSSKGHYEAKVRGVWVPVNLREMAFMAGMELKARGE